MMIIYSMRRVLSAVAITASFLCAGPADAVVTFDLSGACSLDCGPNLGVLTDEATTVTGAMTLDIPAAPDAQAWDASVVLGYSFTFGAFTIDDGNSTLSEAGSVPFTTQATIPFTPGDGFLVATYDAEPNVFLNIGLGGLNLVQAQLPLCDPGGSPHVCQAIVPGAPWSRRTGVPEPASAALLGLGVGLLGLARRRRRYRS